MRVLVCGGRNYGDERRVFETLDEWHRRHGVTEVITGGATGADALARRWAREAGVPYREFPADWKTHGRAAGPIRNQQMLDEAKPDTVLAFPGGAGTADMMRRARAAGVTTVAVRGRLAASV